MSRPSSRAASAAVAAALAVALHALGAAAQTQPPPSAANVVKASAQAVAQRAAAPAQPAAAPAQPAAAPAPAQPAAPGAVASPAPAPGGLLVPGSDFRYDPTGRRDPFKSLLQLEKKQRDVSQLPPIQQFDLESARVVGIIVDPKSGAQAMVKAPNGQTFVVRVGTIIGKNEGEVVEITLQGIRIIEKFLDFMNRETRKETFLKSHPTAAK
jgi:type IV pilus assembly protein PilP